MRVVQLSVYDAQGGAARAASRLHAALRAAGLDSRMLVRTARGDHPGVVSPASALARGYGLVRAWADARATQLLYPGRTGAAFGGALLPERMAGAIRAEAPDLVHVHWVGEGFVRPESLARAGRPVVWTLHDSWAFTGGCHLPGDCRRFSEVCGSCPVLGSTRERDLSRRGWRRRERAYRGLDLTCVAPSRWMAERARASSLLASRRVEIVPNGVDTALYHPVAREVARDLLGLPLTGELVLLAALGPAAEANKGLARLVEALRLVRARRPEVRLLVAGASGGTDATPVPVHALGALLDESSMVLAHAAADVVAIPSAEENLPNVALEALACGRPVAAFGVGGIPEAVRDRETGALAAPGDVAGLARAIGWLLEDPARWRALSAACREDATARFGVERCAARHVALYGELLAGAASRGSGA